MVNSHPYGSDLHTSNGRRLSTGTFMRATHSDSPVRVVVSGNPCHKWKKRRTGPSQAQIHPVWADLFADPSSCDEEQRSTCLHCEKSEGSPNGRLRRVTLAGARRGCRRRSSSMDCRNNFETQHPAFRVLSAMHSISQAAWRQVTKGGGCLMTTNFCLEWYDNPTSCGSCPSMLEGSYKLGARNHSVASQLCP